MGESLKGKLLIASPGLSDPNFARTVVLVAEHNDQGALGLILNRPTDLKLADLWTTILSTPGIEGKTLLTPEMASDLEAHAYLGGPVQRNAVLVLHAEGDLAEESDPVVPGVYLGSDVELLGELVQRASVGGIEESRFRVYCGYSGWGAGQLDAEMEAGGWLMIDATSDHVFAEETATLWSRSLAKLGGAFRLLSLMPPNPELN